MTMDTMTLVFSLLAILLTCVTAGFSILSYCKVVGMEKSTHQVQMMPMEEYTTFQKAINENDDVYYDKMGKEITDPIEKEKIREKELLKSFEEAYTQE